MTLHGGEVDPERVGSEDMISAVKRLFTWFVDAVAERVVQKLGTEWGVSAKDNECTLKSVVAARWAGMAPETFRKRHAARRVPASRSAPTRAAWDRDVLILWRLAGYPPVPDDADLAEWTAALFARFGLCPLPSARESGGVGRP